MIFRVPVKHPSLSPSLTKRLKIHCWQSFTISQGSSWWLTGYSALSTRLGLLNLVASFLMSRWVQEKDQTWAQTDEHQIAHHSGDALLSNLKYSLLLHHPSGIEATPFFSSPSIFTEFSFFSVERYYSSLTFCIKSCLYPAPFQAVSRLYGSGTPPYPILPFRSP